MAWYQQKKPEDETTQRQEGPEEATFDQQIRMAEEAAEKQKQEEAQKQQRQKEIEEEYVAARIGAEELVRGWTTKATERIEEDCKRTKNSYLLKLIGGLQNLALDEELAEEPCGQSYFE